MAMESGGRSCLTIGVPWSGIRVKQGFVVMEEMPSVLLNKAYQHVMKLLLGFPITVETK